MSCDRAKQGARGAERSSRSVAILLLALCGACSRESGPARRVVLITCDTLRADRLGVYGCERDTSPAVDEFAARSLVFDNGYSTAPWTGPALSSLMTGRLPDEIGVSGGNRYPLPAAARTLAEVLGQRGIPTAAVVSNWVLRRPDGALAGAGLAQGFDHYDDQMTLREKNREHVFERTAEDTAGAAIRWLEERKRAGEERFFLWVHFQDPHGPYMPPPELEREFQRPASERSLALGKTNKGKGQIPAYQVVGSEQDPEFYRARYDAEVRRFDAGFGRLMDWIEGQGWLDDALVIMTADHGESLGEHGYWFSHGEHLYRELVRVPFIVHFPRGAARPANGASEGTERTALLASHLDLWPTVLEAFDVAAGPNRGASLFASALPADRIMAHSLQPAGTPLRWEAVSDGSHRLVIETGRPPRLYDVRTDPLEEHDLAASDPEGVARMLARYRSFLASHAAPALRGELAPVDGEGSQALDQLGYTEGEE